MIILALLIAFEAAGQSVPRFLFTPIVRPFDYRPVVGGPEEFRFNTDKNGSLDPTGTKGFEMNATWTPRDPNGVVINQFTFPGSPDGNQTIGSWQNRRITRWTTETPGGSNLKNKPKNPNLKLRGDLNGSIQIYAAPQRPMIDDSNASQSYLIPPVITGGTVTVRNSSYPYSVTAYGIADKNPTTGVSNDPNTNPWVGQDLTGGNPFLDTTGNGQNRFGDDSHRIPEFCNLGFTSSRPLATCVLETSNVQGNGQGHEDVVGQWKRLVYWYDFNVEAPSRGGLNGQSRYSIAGLPNGPQISPNGSYPVTWAIPDGLTGATPALVNRGANSPFGAIQTLAAQVAVPQDIAVGWCIEVKRTEGTYTTQRTVNGNNVTITHKDWQSNGHTVTYELKPLADVRNSQNQPIPGDSQSSLSSYTRNMLFNTSSFFSDFIITSGVLDNNQNVGNNNSGNFTGNNPTLQITSVRDINAMMQFGDLRLKMRQIMRLPQLGPEYLFLNLQNPSLGPGRPNLLQ